MPDVLRVSNKYCTMASTRIPRIFANPIHRHSLRPSEWKSFLRGTKLDPLERLSQWTGGATTIVPEKHSPSKWFTPASNASIKGKRNLYVVVHGWAPGAKDEVDSQPAKALWWSDALKNDEDGGRWPSAWAWSPSTDGVSSTGMLQQILRADENAAVFAYSWIDQSATSEIALPHDWASRSESFTFTNGVRLAGALQHVLTAPHNDYNLHLIGHSHGSKVCTIATAMLRQMNIHVSRLTLLDSPEIGLSSLIDAANLLPFYVERLMDPNDKIIGCGSRPTVIENLFSQFGSAYYLPNCECDSLFQVNLRTTGGPSERHNYAATWYAHKLGTRRANMPLLYHTDFARGHEFWTEFKAKDVDEFKLIPVPLSPQAHTYASTVMQLTEQPEGQSVTSAHLSAADAMTEVRLKVGGEPHGHLGVSFDVQWGPHVVDTDVLVMSAGEGDDSNRILCTLTGDTALRRHSTGDSSTGVVIPMAIDWDDDACSELQFNLESTAADAKTSRASVTVNNFRLLSADDNKLSRITRFAFGQPDSSITIEGPKR